MLALACALAFLPQDEVTLVVRNPGLRRRQEVVQVSVPFAFGRVRELPTLVAGEQPVACVPLLRWRDRSLAVVQAQFELELDAGERKELRLRLADRAPAPIPVGPDRELPELTTELQDPWGTSYVARLSPDPHGRVQDTPLVRVQRLLGVHRDAAGREFLGVVAYLKSYRGTDRAELTLVLDNGASPWLAARPLGPVRFTSFALRLPAGIAARARFARENALPPPTTDAHGTRWQLLGPSPQLYLGDATAKAFRFDLCAGAVVPPDPPFEAWVALDDVRRSRAFGLGGGPAPALGPGHDDSGPRFAEWRRGAWFGPFGGFGDEPDAEASGIRRDGPSALHDVVRWASAELRYAAEGAALQQTLRPTPGRAPRLPADLAPFRQGLSPRAIAVPHGWTALDYEHFSVGLLFDWYWLSGDPLARDELIRTGQGLVPLLRGLPFMTSRGEGCCLEAGVKIARATGGELLERFLLERVTTVLAPALGRAPQPFALAQPPHRDAFGDGVPFDAPWQMALLVQGLYGLFQSTGDERVAAAAVQVAEVMAGPGWLAGVGPKTLVSARDAGRYRMPVEHGPLEGTAMLAVPAFVLAAELSLEPGARASFAERAGAIALPAWSSAPAAAHANPWLQLWCDRRGSRP